MNHNLAPNNFSPFYNSLKGEVKMFQNITCILEKTEQDGYITMITNTFEQILTKEMTYAVQGELKRIKKDKRKKSFFGYKKSTYDKHLDF
jgi:hypothetical protein